MLSLVIIKRSLSLIAIHAGRDLEEQTTIIKYYEACSSFAASSAK
jgi:hypothetical protein